MYRIASSALALSLLFGARVGAAAAETPLPETIAAPGTTVVLSVHAEGAQVYECKVGADGKPAWAFREPSAVTMPAPTGRPATAAPWSAKPSAMRPARRQTIFPG
jgi:hypothetical protein